MCVSTTPQNALGNPATNLTYPGPEARYLIFDFAVTTNISSGKPLASMRLVQYNVSQTFLSVGRGYIFHIKPRPSLISYKIGSRFRKKAKPQSHDRWARGEFLVTEFLRARLKSLFFWSSGSLGRRRTDHGGSEMDSAHHLHILSCSLRK